MDAIIHDLPFYDKETPLKLPGGTPFTVKDYQIVLWASIAPKGMRELPQQAQRFPIVLSTALRQNVTIDHRWLLEWAHIDSLVMPAIGHTKLVGREQVPLLPCNVWLHRNLSGHRDRFANDQKPFCLELDQGIAVFPRAMKETPLPCLGMRAFVVNRLRIAIDGENLRVSIHRA